MESFSHHSHKLPTETVIHPPPFPRSSPTPIVPPPPAYSPNVTQDTPMANDLEAIELTLDASVHVTGNSNLICVDPFALSMRVSAILSAATYSHGPQFSPSSLDIDCSVHVSGERNVVGPAMPRPIALNRDQHATPAAAAVQAHKNAAAAASQARKRKADDEPKDAPHSKRTASA